jgi:hypothetical protein
MSQKVHPKLHPLVQGERFSLQIGAFENNKSEAAGAFADGITFLTPHSQS